MDRVYVTAAPRRGAGNRWVLLAIVIAALVAANGLQRPPQPEADDAADAAGQAVAQTADAAAAPRDDGSVITLPRAIDTIRWDRYVGKRVRIPGELVVVDTYNLASRGQVSLATDRLTIPTQTIDPNDETADGVRYEGKSNAAAVNAAQKRNNASWVVLDDNSNEMDRFPVALFPEFGDGLETVRLGSTVSGVVGTVRQRDGRFFVVADQPLTIQPVSRPERPDLGDANVTVASFNVLNYFSTIDDGQNQARGADSPSEWKRQTEKLVAAIIEMDADVIGLMELENNLRAEQQLVAAINEKLGDQVYAASGLPQRFGDLPGGGDVIRVGMIYRRDRVEATGPIQAIDDNAFWNGRTPLYRTFRRRGGKDPFTVVVNHFKSKGSRDAKGDDADQRDGQSAYNASRRSQARAVAEAIESRMGTDRVLVIGDLNAYRQEDPIDLLRANGLVDLTAEDAYSYVYFGQIGSLDHAFATADLAKHVTAAAVWHINADEPRCLDYNEEFGKGAYYRPTPFRCSDHDPLLIGLRLQ